MAKVWRARSASDKTDDWLFWYVTDDEPKDRNKTLDAIEYLTGLRPYSYPFVRQEVAEELAERMNKTSSLEGVYEDAVRSRHRDGLTYT
jgi:hypothetical protein